MLSVREYLIEGLRENVGLNVYISQPPINVGVSIPLLILDETQNSDKFYELNGMQIVHIGYEISVYATDTEELFHYMPLVDRYMKQLGFKKTYTSSDMYVDNLFCKTMRYTAKIKEQNNDIIIL